MTCSANTCEAAAAVDFAGPKSLQPRVKTHTARKYAAPTSIWQSRESQCLSAQDQCPWPKSMSSDGLEDLEVRAAKIVKAVQRACLRLDQEGCFDTYRLCACSLFPPCAEVWISGFRTKEGCCAMSGQRWQYATREDLVCPVASHCIARQPFGALRPSKRRRTNIRTVQRTAPSPCLWSHVRCSSHVLEIAADSRWRMQGNGVQQPALLPGYS